MGSFLIDDVRDTFGADIAGLLGRIEDRTRAILALPRLEAGAEPGSGSPFDALADAGHALYGTSSLVAAESLSSSAALLEQLAARGRDELATAERSAQVARSIATLLADGAREMRAMLALELEHRGDDAQWVAMEWQERAAALVLAAPGAEHGSRENGAAAMSPRASAPAPDEDGGHARAEVAQRSARPFSLEDLDVDGMFGNLPGGDSPTTSQRAWAAVEPAREDAAIDAMASAVAGADGLAEVDHRPPPSANGDGFEFAFDDDDGDAEGEAAQLAATDERVNQELVEVFQQEARESIVALHGHLRALFADPSDVSHAEHLERIYHTLKGSSATVGLERVSGMAAALQERMESLLVGGDGVSPAVFASIVSDTNELLASGGLPEVSVASIRGVPLPARRGAAQREVHGAFIEEARVAKADAAQLVEELALAAAGERPALTERLGAIFHRLTGSALVAGEERIATEAEQLQAACHADAPPTTAELASGLARIVALLGIAADPVPAKPAPESEGALDGARAVFVEEARQILTDSRSVLLEAAKAPDEHVAELAAELAKLFHRLKGSAAVLAFQDVASEAAALQELCEARPEASEMQRRVGQGTDRIAGLLALSIASPVDRRSEATTDEIVRERVPATDPELWQTFTQECAELLDTLERDILALEDSDRPRVQLEALLRHYHSLKGIVNTLGLGPTGKAIHLVEDFLEALRPAPILPAMRSIASCLLQLQVEIRKNLKQAQKGYVEISLKKVRARLAQMTPGRSERQPSSARESALSALSAGSADSESGQSEAAHRRFVRVPTDRLDILMNLAGELVVNRSRLNSRVDLLRGLQTELGRGSRRLIDTVETFREEHEFGKLNGHAPLPAGQVRRAKPTDDIATPDTTAWGAFGELELDRYEDVHVLSRSLAEITSDFNEIYGQLTRGLATLTDDSDVFGSIVSGIQTEVTRARMVPMDILFTRLRLPIRDAAAREAKDVRVATQGEEVHLDKTIADALFQPMLHLVRNAVAHGLESASTRAAAGKSPAGTVSLRARQELGQIVVEVKDDGRGLDLAALRERGVAMGLLSPETDIDDPAVKDLVFAAGLSTQHVAGAVAGRGVGCDVVRRAVERLNGTIRVETVASEGTTLILTLPVTLAITKALLVRSRSHTFAVPLYFAERIVDFEGREVVESAGVRRVSLDGAFVPVKRLGEMFGEHGDDPRGPMLVLRVGDQRMVVQVDAVLAQEEIVVKSLGALLVGHPAFAGVTIRGNGELVLILDVPGLAASRGARLAPRAPRPRPQAERGLPLPEAPQENERTESSSAMGALRVLFVDDSISVRKVAEMNLRGLGAEVTVAVDGMDALNKLREATFDIVFTDLEMPRMHGYELIRELRFLPMHRDLPIIVVTSRSGQKHQEQARQLGATEYITKPFTIQSLEAALKRWGRRRGQAPTRSEQDQQPAAQERFET
jgi:chemosensory pili system protein ChpA (sensor histidine kinase/response regulator)